MNVRLLACLVFSILIASPAIAEEIEAEIRARLLPDPTAEAPVEEEAAADDE